MVEKICLSVKKFVSEDCGKSDQIFHLTTNLGYRLFEKIDMGKDYLINYFVIYIFVGIEY